MRVERDQRVALLILLAMVGLFLALHWAPRRLKEARLNGRIAQARAQLAADAGGTAQLVSLSREVAELETQAASLRREVPRESQLASLLRHLTGELERLEVTDQEMQTQPLATGSNYSVIPVTLKFRGTFAAALTLVRNIESMPRLVRLTRVELRGEPGKPREPLRVSVELCAFFTQPAEGKR